MQRGVLVGFLGFFLFLVACAPSTSSEKVSVEQFAGQVSYYPHEAGASWSYLPADASVDNRPLVYAIQGPTVIDNDIWVATSVLGVGLNGVRYRQFRPDGVFLLRETAPGLVVTNDPPIQEFPAEGSLRVGATWGGDTSSTVYFPDAKAAEQYQTFQINYNYTVVDKRTVNLQAGTFDVFVINRVGRRFDDLGNELEAVTQEIWFAPGIGEVRTREGFFLVESNVLQTAVSQ